MIFLPVKPESARVPPMTNLPVPLMTYFMSSAKDVGWDNVLDNFLDYVAFEFGIVNGSIVLRSYNHCFYTFGFAVFVFYGDLRFTVWSQIGHEPCFLQSANRLTSLSVSMIGNGISSFVLLVA